MSVAPCQHANPPTQLTAFDLRSLFAAVLVIACLLGLVHFAIEMRDRALGQIALDVSRPSSTLCVSNDGKMSASTVGLGTIGIVCDTGKQTFAIELSHHPHDGHLYALNRLALHNGQPKWQEWNPIEARWQPSDEGLLLKIIHSTNEILVLVIIGFVVACVTYIRGRARRWLRGIIPVLGVSLLALVSLKFAPIMWRGSCFTAATFNSDASQLGTASVCDAHSIICVWDTSNGQGVTTFDVPNSYATSLVFSDDDNALVASNRNTWIAKWRIEP